MPPKPRESVGRLSASLALLIVASGWVVYANSFHGVFLFDDVVKIVQNDRLTEWPPWQMLRGHRPVADLTLAINYQLGGLNVWGYHAVNLAVHILAGLALFGVVRRLLSLSIFRPSVNRAAPGVALATGLIWLVHPLQTQSVTYVIQRAESLMGMFYLLTMYCVVRSADSRRSLWWSTAAVVACGLGMGSKAVMVTAPIAAFLLDAVFLSRSYVASMRRRWTLWAGLAATWGVLAYSGIAKDVLDPGRTFATVGLGFKGVSPVEYALTQPGVIARYLLLSIWPSPICLDYRWPIAETLGAIAPAILLLLFVAMTVTLLCKRRPLGFCMAWFLLILGPTSSVIPIKDALFEHRMYLPLAGIIAPFVVGGYLLGRWTTARLFGASGLRSLMAGAISLVVIVCLATGTIRRNRVYHSAAGMWRDVISKRPNNPRAYEQLGTLLIAEDNYEGAIDAYRGAVRADPGFTSAHANLGNALHQSDALAEAIEQYEVVVRQDPQHIISQMHLGDALEQLGRVDEAIEAYRVATQMTPKKRNREAIPRAFFNYASALARNGDFELAAAEYEKALAINPEYERAHYALGLVFTRLGKHDEAIAQFQETLRINPKHPVAQRALEQSLQKKQTQGS